MRVMVIVGVLSLGGCASLGNHHDFEPVAPGAMGVPDTAPAVPMTL